MSLFLRTDLGKVKQDPSYR